MDFNELKKAAFSEASKLGLKEYDLFYMAEESMESEAFRDEIQSAKSSVSGGISFRAIVDGHVGMASTEVLTEEEMKNLVSKAYENGKYIDNEDKHFIYEGASSYEKVPPRDYEESDMKTLKDKTLALQKTIYDKDSRISDGTSTGVYSSYLKIHLANSKGLDLEDSKGMSFSYGSAVARQGEGDNIETRSGSHILCCPLKDMTTMEEAVKDAVSQFGASKDIISGKRKIVFSSGSMRQILGTFSSVFSGVNVQMGLSLLRDKLNEVIGSSCVTICDDPFDERWNFTTAFDCEGYPTYKKNVVEKGVLKTFLYDMTSAAKDGVSSTGNGFRSSYNSFVSVMPNSFYLCPGSLTKEELYHTCKDGIYVTEMKGFHAGASPITGDFSIESAGFEIKDGKVGRPLEGFTVAGNFYSLLKDIEAISNEVEFGFPSGNFTRFGSPEVLVKELVVGGV